MDDTDEAIKRSYRNANLVWKEKTLQNLFDFCVQHETFSMNEFREYNKHMDPYIKTQDNRAMGGVVKEAQKRGWIKPTGNLTVSKVGHKVPIQIWESLIKSSEVIKI